MSVYRFLKLRLAHCSCAPNLYTLFYCEIAFGVGRKGIDSSCLTLLPIRSLGFYSDPNDRFAGCLEAIGTFKLLHRLHDIIPD